MKSDQIVRQLIKDINPDFLDLPGVHIMSCIRDSNLTVAIISGFSDTYTDYEKTIDLNHPDSLKDLSGWLENIMGELYT